MEVMLCALVRLCFLETEDWNVFQSCIYDDCYVFYLGANEDRMFIVYGVTLSSTLS